MRGVIALDTAIDSRSRLDLESYVAPTADDVRFISTFAMTDDAVQLAAFLAEDWVQDWIEQVFPAPRLQSDRGLQTTPHNLDQLASYLALLSVVRRAGVLPSLQFFETRADVAPPTPVDLVLDIGHSRSCAMLVESSAVGSGPGANARPHVEHATLLKLRDLSRPLDVHLGAFESRIEFSRATFGPEAISRRSGRTDAFHWPSLARTGHEAIRLARDSRSGDGATGLASPKRHLSDLAPRNDTWRFSPDRRGNLSRGQMLSGKLLTLAAEPTGRLLPGPEDAAPREAAQRRSLPNGGPEAATRAPSLRPRFSLSSTMSFLIAEIVLQALSQINAPVVATGHKVDDAAAARRAEGARRLRHVIVCVPLTLPLQERQLTRERAEAAIDLLWRALDWDDQVDSTMPPRPTVRLGLDETLAAQLVYLFDEVGQRFGGDVRTVMSTIGKNRPDFGVEPCLRLGALDVGGGHSTMTVVTYAQAANAPVTPTLLGAQRSDIGGEVVLERIVGEAILPPLARTLALHGLEQPEGFLARHAGSPGAGANYDIAGASTRVYEHWLRPAAFGLLSLAHDAPGGDARITLRLADLVARGGHTPSRTVAEEFAAASLAAGAAGFDLGDIEIRMRLGDVLHSAKAALSPMIARLSHALVASDCDVVLLTGWAARLRVTRDLLLEAMPWRPDRIAVLTDRTWHDWYPMTAEARLASDGKDIGLLGALLALSGGGIGFGAMSFGADADYSQSGFGPSDLGPETRL